MTTLKVENPGRCPFTVNPTARPATSLPPRVGRRRFVLLDRDGTLIVHRPYLGDPSAVELLPGAAAGLHDLQQAGFGLAIVTNQSGIGRRYFSFEQFYAVQDRLLELLLREGVTIDGVYFCPHAPQEQCGCRKPKPRLVQRAAVELDFDPVRAFVVGDSLCDMELARNVGAAGVLIRPEGDGGAGFASLREAAQWIMQSSPAAEAA